MDVQTMCYEVMRCCCPYRQHASLQPIMALRDKISGECDSQLLGGGAWCESVWKPKEMPLGQRKVWVQVPDWDVSPWDMAQRPQPLICGLCGGLQLGSNNKS